MEQRTEELGEIETLTLSHYDQNAEAFWNGTKDHDVTQNYEAFLAPFPKDKKLDILDLGCGPGRDVNYFKHGETVLNFLTSVSQYNLPRILCHS